MTIQQLSVFLENKPGTLGEILNKLKAGNIQIIASSISDTVDYGIYRIITPEPRQAYDLLREAGHSAKLSDIFAVSLDHVVGKAAEVINLLAEAGISIAYLYSFLVKDKGILVFRTSDPAATEKIILERNISYLSESDLQTFC